MDSPAGARRDDNPGQKKGSRGRRSDVALLIAMVRDPGSLRPNQRAAVKRLRERVDGPMLALIVRLEDLILTVHGSRDAFLAHLHEDRSSRAGRLTKQTLTDHLGGRKETGPDWWLADLIATHCVPRGEDPQRVMDGVCQLWHAVYGTPPPGHGPVLPATPQMISELIDPPFDPSDAGAETAQIRRRAEEAGQALAIAQRQAGEERAQRLAAEAQAETAWQALGPLRERFAGAERDRYAHRDRAAQAEIQAAQYREQLARAHARLEIAGSSALDDLSRVDAAAATGLATELVSLQLLLSRTAPASHRALAAYVGTHAVLTGNLGPEETAPGLPPDMTKRFLRSQYLPSLNMVLTIAEAAGADASYTRHLYSAAAQDRNNTAVNEEFSQIVAELEEKETRPPAAKAEKNSWPEWLAVLIFMACIIILAIASACTIGVVTGFFVADTTYLVYRSGDKPRTLTVQETCVDGCIPSTEPNGYQWRVGPRSRQRTAFSFYKDGTAALGPSRRSYLTGTLQYSLRGCPGSQIAWKINITGSSPIFGTLNSHHSQVKLNKLIPDNPAITVQINRTDDLSCTSRFTWNNALRLRPAPVKH